MLWDAYAIRARIAAADPKNLDLQLARAVRPGLATTGGPLIIASSPYARKGILWDAFRRHYGATGDKLILVAIRKVARLPNPGETS